jgi:hypothetical protein
MKGYYKMEWSEFLILIHDYGIALLDAHTSDERQSIADEIALDSDLASGILMLLSEQIFPLLPDPVEVLAQ